MRDDTPVLIGGGQFARRVVAGNPPSSLKLLKVAAERVVLAARLKGSVLADLDALAVMAFGIGDRGRRFLARSAG